MIANLMTTLLLAFGVATGNVSSNVYKGGNAFNHEKEIKHHDEKPVQKALYTETFNYNNQNTYNSTETKYGLQITSENSKYYIDNSLSRETEIGTIYNSVYVSNIKTTSGAAVSESEIAEIYNITPYINSYNNQFTLEKSIRWSAASTHNITIRTTAYIMDNNVKNYIDLTTYYVSSLDYQIKQEYLATATEIYNNTRNTIATTGNNYITFTINVGTIESETTVYVYTYMGADTPVLNETIISAPNEITIQGYHQDINYEVIDLPNLMFTILTMPFSFYSTAFNLTIFPGTPYALNFGNIVLTLIAAMILLYLIKKIIK